MERRAARREIARGREPEAAAVRKLDELLRAGASDGVLANQLGALVAEEGRGKELGGAVRTSLRPIG